jgi:mannose-6-phosphate isomerase
VVYELQQDSDITYRLYDWGRTNREMHLEKGLRAIDSNCANMEITHPALAEQEGSWRASLVDCDFFNSQLWCIPHRLRASAPAESFLLLTVLEGSGSITSPLDAYAPVEMAAGTTLCVPASLEYVLQNNPDSANTPLKVITGQVTHS